MPSNPMACEALAANGKALAIMGVASAAVGALPVSIVTTTGALFSDYQARRCRERLGAK